MAKRQSRSRHSGGRHNRRDKQIATIRWAILGGASVLAAAVLVWGLVYSTGNGMDGSIVEGDHYRVVEDPPKRRPGAPIVVTEFFSYGCIHCRTFYPLVHAWRENLAEDVEFERAPVTFSPDWAILGQAYLALEQTGALQRNHERLFRAIHDNGRRFATPAQVADFVDGNGVTREAFLTAYNSNAVKRKLARNESRQRKLAIASTPTLVVADKYVIDMDVGRRRSLEVADHLVALERQSASKAAPKTAAAPSPQTS